jgi:hypothetical protein
MITTSLLSKIYVNAIVTIFTQSLIWPKLCFFLHQRFCVQKIDTKKKKKNNRFNGDNRNVKTNGKRRSKQWLPSQTMQVRQLCKKQEMIGNSGRWADEHQTAEQFWEYLSMLSIDTGAKVAHRSIINWGDCASHRLGFLRKAVSVYKCNAKSQWQESWKNLPKCSHHSGFEISYT